MYTILNFENTSLILDHSIFNLHKEKFMDAIKHFSQQQYSFNFYANNLTFSIAFIFA